MNRSHDNSPRYLVAVVEMLLRLAQVIHAPYYALFLVGPTAMVAELAWKKRNEAADGQIADSPLPESKT